MSGREMRSQNKYERFIHHHYFSILTYLRSATSELVIGILVNNLNCSDKSFRN